MDKISRSGSGSSVASPSLAAPTVVPVPSVYVPPPGDGDVDAVGGVLTTLPVLGICGVGATPVSYSTTVFNGIRLVMGRRIRLFPR